MLQPIRWSRRERATGLGRAGHPLMRQRTIAAYLPPASTRRADLFGYHPQHERLLFIVASSARPRHTPVTPGKLRNVCDPSAVRFAQQPYRELHTA